MVYWGELERDKLHFNQKWDKQKGFDRSFRHGRINTGNSETLVGSSVRQSRSWRTFRHARPTSPHNGDNGTQIAPSQ